MDRSSEFLHLVDSLETPQSKPSIFNSGSQISQMFSEINTLINLLEKGSSYEKYLSGEKIKKTLNLLEKYKVAINSLDFSHNNDNEKLHTKNLKEMLKNLHSKMMIRFNKVCEKKREKISRDVERRSSFSYVESSDSSIYQSQIYEEKHQQANDRLRKRLNVQMNELGQIVSDISLHVSLQGEEIRRIDDLVDNSQNFIKESLYEINKTWEKISMRRRRMIKFFSFWLLLALLFWYFRKK